MAAAKGKMPPRNKKNFRSTKSGAGMTKKGVAAYRKLNPGSKLKTAVTGEVKKGSTADSMDERVWNPGLTASVIGWERTVRSTPTSTMTPSGMRWRMP